MDWEFGVSSGKLVYRECINNTVPLYSPGNYMPFPVLNHNGKEYEKEAFVCSCTTESLCCTSVINTTL